MPDTPALPQAFSQPTVQRPGCGFPVARLLGGTGLLMKLVVAPLWTHDLAHVQQVHPILGVFSGGDWNGIPLSTGIMNAFGRGATVCSCITARTGSWMRMPR
jgi:hypothetical protein